MKFLIVMRGHCNRNENIQYIYDNYLIKIKYPLLKNGHTLDCMFNTYNGYDEYFEKFKELYNPIKIFRFDDVRSTKYENIFPGWGFQILNFYDGLINIKPFINSNTLLCSLGIFLINGLSHGSLTVNISFILEMTISLRSL